MNYRQSNSNIKLKLNVEVNLMRRNTLCKLTKAETDVLKGLAEAKSYREIALDRATSPKTVDHQIQSIFSKLGVTNRTQAVIRAIRRGLIDLDDNI